MGIFKGGEQSFRRLDLGPGPLDLQSAGDTLEVDWAKTRAFHAELAVLFFVSNFIGAKKFQLIWRRISMNDSAV